MQFKFDEIDFNCNKIHEALIAEGEVVCFLCHEMIIDINISQKNKGLCSDCNNTPSLIEDGGMIVCSACGHVDDHLIVPDVELYNNNHIRKKSIYRNKYHIQNILNDMRKNHRIQVPVRIELLICRIIHLIRSSEEIMQGRKRIISIKYIIRRIFKLVGLPYDFIPRSKSEITRKKYNTYWHSVMKSSIGCEIK